MTAQPSEYHRRVAAQKRTAIVEAATKLFLDSGYDGTSLARIAEAAGVSRATLFKQFATKAALFEAIVTEHWKADDEAPLPEPGNLRAGLEAIGRRYVALLTRPGMAALFRIVIAEVPRFPELGETQFKLGKMPYFESVRRYLAAENAAGTARLDDAEMAATQFLGMISNYVFWPRMLLAHWEPDDAAVADAVDQAVLTMLARYGVPGSRGA
ncbi:TetR/AcrR family transcriptional regulator [Streptomyces sp. TRM66268-LWL]|uniref:TetR/AcrR family transcriptional regulator n=1 Tax=Streptomyces polyasparticus TaxID=2767826 RepID=A0ABR7SQY4_9ACTN|nr:TetR/AcrR family transcriptional regulator [Streptomyces polyasparticus]MBC9717347.1 TetR/AcrR family transcriptional regulator [Streptomyces polyasparticus]